MTLFFSILTIIQQYNHMEQEILAILGLLVSEANPNLYELLPAFLYLLNCKIVIFEVALVDVQGRAFMLSQYCTVLLVWTAVSLDGNGVPSGLGRP
jgi:Na+-translocating ferredoxin:NAD+ oxidoreductase RnfA subunit